jgi:phosphoribosylformylglycinamidine synthase PurS subunit
MSHFRIAVHITPRRGILDPQGKTVAGALHTLGFASVTDVHVGRYIIVELDAADRSDAERQTREMCEKLLANPVIEDFEIADVRHPDAREATPRHPDASGGSAFSAGRH